MTTTLPSFATPPHRLSGLVLGTLLNHRDALDALGAAIDQPPYKAAPKAPVLYIKPRNTLAASGSTMRLPPGTERLELGASVGLVIGRTACRVSEGAAMAHVAGCVLIADLSVPHRVFYRPSIRFKALDGSCLIGPMVAGLDALTDPDEIVIDVAIDGQTVHRSGGPLVRSAARLLADVSDFMTLHPGDVLMLGVSAGAPLIDSGSAFTLTAPGLGRLQGRVVTEAEFAE